MTPHLAAALIIVIILLLLNAFFTLAEAALTAVRHARLQQMVAEGEAAGSAGSVQRLMRQPTRVVAAVQVGLTLASFAIAAVSATVLSEPVSRLLHKQGVHHDIRWSVVLTTLAAALVSLIIGSLIPRSISRRNPERIAILVAVPITFFIYLFSVLADFAIGISNVIVKPFGLKATFEAPLITEEELRTLLEASAQSGAIEEDEKEIIRNVISFGDTDVRQVMTPRIDMKALDITCAFSDLVALIITSGHSRIPMYEGSVDTIVGIIHAKDLLPALACGEQSIELRSVARHPLFISENKRVDELLDEFRRSNIQLAIVQDEYGGTAGLVTIEDLLEELVGDIKDEYDIEEPMVQVISPEMSLIDGRMQINDVNEQMGLDLPHEDYDTIAGFIFGLFGHQPEVGESIRYETIEFVVEKTDGRRIQTVRLLRRSIEDNESSEEASRADTGGT